MVDCVSWEHECKSSGLVLFALNPRNPKRVKKIKLALLKVVGCLVSSMSASILVAWQQRNIPVLIAIQPTASFKWRSTCDWLMTGKNDENEVEIDGVVYSYRCDICWQELDDTDIQFKPCRLCHLQVCLFCFNKHTNQKDLYHRTLQPNTTVNYSSTGRVWHPATVTWIQWW